MLDFVQTYPWLTAGAAAGVLGAGALGYWLNSNEGGEVEYFPEEVRKDILSVMKKFGKGKIKLSSAEKKELRQLLAINVCEGSLAEKFLEKTEPIIGAVLASTAKGAAFAFEADDDYEEVTEEIKEILLDMEKFENNRPWYKKL